MVQVYLNQISEYRNPRDLSQKIAFLVYMNLDYFRVRLCVGLYLLFQVQNMEILIICISM